MGAQPSRKRVWFIQLFHGGDVKILPSSSELVADIRKDSRALTDSIPEAYQTPITGTWRSWVYAETLNEAMTEARERIARVAA